MKPNVLAGSTALSAPTIFTLLSLGQGWMQPTYSHKKYPVSALAAWPFGKVQSINYYVYGGLIVAFAVLLHQTIRSSTRTDPAGPALIGAAGIGAIITGAVPWHMVPLGPDNPARHAFSGSLHFLGASIGLIILSERLNRDPRWKDFAAWTRTSGIAMLATFLAFTTFGLPDSGPLHPWAGVIQRISMTFWFVWLVGAAIKLFVLPESGARARRHA